MTRETEEEREKKRERKRERERVEYCRSQNTVGHKIWEEGVANFGHIRPCALGGRLARPLVGMN